MKMRYVNIAKSDEPIKIYDNEIEDILSDGEIIDRLNNGVKFAEKDWAVKKLIIEYDTTNKYSEKDVIDKIKDIIGLVMI